jgi:mono/diheme cytochrome c family protein
MMWCKKKTTKRCHDFRQMNLIKLAQVPLRAILLLTLMTVANLTGAVAQEIGNVEAGGEYAIDHCARCHAVDANTMRSPNPQATPFAQIAVTPGMNARALKAWLTSVHKDMPDFIIEKNDIDDLIAYILSLAPNKEVRLSR